MKLGVMDIFNDLKKQTKTMTTFHLHLTLEAASHNLIWPSIIGINVCSQIIHIDSIIDHISIVILVN